MIRISVMGATGRVGTAVLDATRAAPDLTLTEAISDSGSAGSTPLDRAQLDNADALVEFSTPAAVMALLDRLKGNPMPVVIGTTGFTPDQAERLQAEAAHRPILVGANFTKGFEAFAAAGLAMARALPDADLTVGEIYNATKKPVASGTTQRLCQELGESGRKVGTDIARIGDTPGVNTIELDYGVATIKLTLTVHSRAAYAAGALDAARWLISRPNGFYQPKDMLSD
jgi:4-hydroxy-tetrahydrodipicolinate reductase